MEDYYEQIEKERSKPEDERTVESAEVRVPCIES